jgi:hypothetical protein
VCRQKKTWNTAIAHGNISRHLGNCSWDMYSWWKIHNLLVYLNKESRKTSNQWISTRLLLSWLRHAKHAIWRHLLCAHLVWSLYLLYGVAESYFTFKLLNDIEYFYAIVDIRKPCNLWLIFCAKIFEGQTIIFLGVTSVSIAKIVVTLHTIIMYTMILK